MDNAKGVALLRSRLPSLSPSEARVAEWILERLDELPALTMAGIAHACEVSDTTVLRMCRDAGFRGFTDLKLSLIKSTVTPDRIFLEDARPEDNITTMARKVFIEELQSLYDTLDLLSERTLEKAVHAIEGAERILIAGVGSSNIVGQAAWAFLRRLGRNCTAPVDIHHQVTEAALLGPEDLLIVISYSGHSRDPIEVVEIVRPRGAEILAITGNDRSPLAQKADLCLVSASRQKTADPFSSRISQLALLNALYVILSLRNLDETLAIDDMIDKIGRAHV